MTTLASVPPYDDRERRRQRAVDSLHLEDRASDPRLDRITRLARTVLGVDSAAITVLDHDRAWFPSMAGGKVTSPPRVETFCAVTTQRDDTVVVPDARVDPAFGDLMLVRTGRIAFYAGQPLRDPAGNAVGTFCIFDRNPRNLDAEQLETFLDLAAWAEHEMVASSEMAQAARVQQSLLPAGPLVVPGWEVVGTCLPALAVGGDLYDYSLDAGTVLLGLGDVMGKGTGAALVAAGVRTAVHGTLGAVAAGVDLGITTTQVAHRLHHDLEQADSFVTWFQTAVDTTDGVVRYVDAGSGLALLVRANGEVTQLHGQDPPLGVMSDDHWTEHEEVLEPGDRMVLFSDGILDVVPDQSAWTAFLGRMIAASADAPDLMARITGLTRAVPPLDDVTAVACFRDR